MPLLWSGRLLQRAWRTHMRLAITSLAFGLVVTLGDAASAASPTATLREFFATVNCILRDATTRDRPDDRLAAVRATAREIFDARGAAQLALSPEWDARASAEQEEFTALFAALFERSFLAAFVSRARTDDGVSVAYLAESIAGTTATVRTSVAARNGQDLAVDYRMVERDGRFLVRDVVMDGVSAVANYRAQFARVMQASSYEGLVTQLRARLGTDQPVRIVARDLPSAPVAPAEPDVQPPAPSTEVAMPEPPVRPEPPHEPAGPVTVSAPHARLEGAALANPAAPKPRTYWVQVGAFKSRTAAARLKSTLMRTGTMYRDPSRIVIDSPRPGHALATVRIGPFREKGPAISTVHQLEATGYPSFITSDR